MNKYIRIPSGVLRLFKSKFDWNYQTNPEPSVNNRSIYLCRGKVLGGSSCLNVQLYNRGNENDYKIWEKVSGSSDWSIQSIIASFKKSEDFFLGKSKYHSTDGEYSVSQVPYQNPLSKTFLEACDEFGYNQNFDFNDWSHSQEGYGRFHVSQKNGERSSAASGFLKPILNRKNLKVITSAIVSKINIDNNKQVHGVEALVNGELKTFQLSHNNGLSEVLLTSGSIGSPQILLLSGIGPKQHLEEQGIPVILDLPAVGMNLQDHPATLVSYSAAPGNDGISTSSKLRIKGTTIPNPKAFIQWATTGTGVMTTTGCDHGAFVKTKSELESPDLQLRFVAAPAITPDGMNSLTSVSYHLFINPTNMILIVLFFL